MLPFTNMMNLFTHEFARLSGRGLPFTGIFPCSVNGFLLGHDGLYSQVCIFGRVAVLQFLSHTIHCKSEFHPKG